MAGLRPSFSLYLITDRKLAARHGGLAATVEAALRAASTVAAPGSVAVQLREKDLEARELYEQGRVMRELCSRYHAPLLINDRIDVALAVQADGVHLRTDSIDVRDARELLGSSRLIGVSTHHSDEVTRAAEAGADFVVFGPVYPPLSKPTSGAAGGAQNLSAACRTASGIRVYALGGITPARIGELAGAGAFSERAHPSGVAVIGSVFAADNPAAATCDLLEALARIT